VARDRAPSTEAAGLRWARLAQAACSGTIVCPGVSIGADTVVGAGSVVTRDLPAGVVAAGVPACVIRAIGASDRVQIADLDNPAL
jgi:serine acetyltransferase